MAKSASGKGTSAAMATFPARRPNLEQVIGSIAPQVDELYLVANNYEKGALKDIEKGNVRVIYPPRDLRDTGKFFQSFPDSQFVLLCDDDIIYPPDYVDTLKEEYRRFEHLTPIIGVHGVTYSDFFDGHPGARIVHVFSQKLKERCFVNQLGTGTVLCKGYQMPSFEFMATSAKFVDLRFAAHCERNGYHRICIGRETGWMKEIKGGGSLFESFTKTWAPEIVREAQAIAGLRLLPQSGLLSDGA